MEKRKLQRQFGSGQNYAFHKMIERVVKGDGEKKASVTDNIGEMKGSIKERIFIYDEHEDGRRFFFITSSSKSALILPMWGKNTSNFCVATTLEDQRERARERRGRDISFDEESRRREQTFLSRPLSFPPPPPSLSWAIQHRSNRHFFFFFFGRSILGLRLLEDRGKNHQLDILVQ